MWDPVHAMEQGMDSILTNRYGVFLSHCSQSRMSFTVICLRTGELSTQSPSWEFSLYTWVDKIFCSKCIYCANFLILNSLILTNFEFSKIYLYIRLPPGRRSLLFIFSIRDHKSILMCSLVSFMEQISLLSSFNKLMYFFSFGEMLNESRETLSRLTWLKANRFL